MARPIYPHELADPDFQWLIATFRERRSVAYTVEESCLPVILLIGDPPTDSTADQNLDPATLGNRHAALPLAGQEE
jgi:hypothetical protein